jgi:ABC-2 type transport system permease protein
MTTIIYDSDAERKPILDEIRALVRYRTLLGELILRNIKTRYKRSVLGIAWTMINPMLTMLVLTIVFSQLFAFSVPQYPVYLLSGLLLWNFYSQTTVASIKDLIWSGGLLKRIFVPRGLFAVAAVGTGIVNLVLSLVPLGIIVFLTDSPIGLSLFFLPVSILIAGMFALGVGLGLSTLAVYFTDIVDMYQIILLAWMYLTPIFYPVEILAPKFQWLIRINPMYYILECFRMPIYLGALPDSGTLVGAVISAIVVLFIGSWVFVRKSDEFPYYI